MKSLTNQLSLLPIAFLFIFVLLTASIGLIQPTIIIFIIAAFVFMITDRKLLIALYIILLPTDGIFPQEYNILGLLNINVVINFITTLSLLPELFKRYNTTSFQKISIYLLYVFFWYLVYLNIKNTYFDLTNINQAFNRVIYYIVEYLPLILIIRLIKNPVIAEIVRFSIYFSAIFLTITALLSIYLDSIGFKIGSEIGLEISSLNRYGGLFGKGDENSFGIFSAMIVGFLFSIFEIRKISFYEIIVLLFAIVGVISSGSRAAIIALLFIFFYYSIRNLSSAKTYRMFFVVGIICLLFSPKIANVLVRFETFSTQLETHHSSNRIGKWILYFFHMIDNPSIFLYGNEKIFSLTSYEKTRAAHNFYVQMIYNTGLIPFIFLMIGHFKFLLIKNKFPLKPIYYVFPFFIELMSVSAFGTLAFLSLIIASNCSDYYTRL
jgi:hypothetical protein